MKLTREEAALLESALFAKMQLCKQNECDIHDWCGVDMWDLFCRLGERSVCNAPPARVEKDDEEKQA